MKRHEALAPLSREHHSALILAQLLKKDAPAYKGLPTALNEKTAYALQMFTATLQLHFTNEEEMLDKIRNVHIEIDKLSDEIFQQFLLQLPDSLQQDIIDYKHWQSAQASLLGKKQIKNAFQQLALNYTLHDIKIGAKDRPFINEEIDFNIS